MASKESLRERFNITNYKRQNEGLRISKELSDLLSFIDSGIKKEFQSFNLLAFSICGGQRRNFQVDPNFEAAFMTLSLAERIAYYQLAITTIQERQKITSIEVMPTQEENGAEYEILNVRIIKGLKANQVLKVRMKEYLLDCGHYEISLRRYILRKSKKDALIFLLESVDRKEPATIRFQLTDYTTSKEDALQAANNKWFAYYITQINKQEDKKQGEIKLSKKAKGTTRRSELSPLKEKGDSDEDPKLNKESPHQNPNNKTVIEELIREDEANNVEEDYYEYIERKNEENRESDVNYEKGKRYRKNIVSVMLPHYNLYELDNYSDYLPVFKDEPHGLFIYHHSHKPTTFKLEVYYHHPPQTVIRHLCELQNYKLWNGTINESQMKLPITSDNTFIMYLKQRAQSEWHKERDFLFLKHVFKMSERYYMVDKSIDNSHFIPFQSINRAIINYAVSRVEAVREDSGRYSNISNSNKTNTPSTNKTSGPNSKLIMEISIEHGGLLTPQGKFQLTLAYLREFVNLQSFINRFHNEFKYSFNIEWNILDIYDSTVPNGSQISMETIPTDIFDNDIVGELTPRADDDQFFSIVDQTEEPKLIRELTLEEVNKKHKVKEVSEYVDQSIALDAEGLAILPKTYLTVKHAVKPVKVEQRRRKLDYENIMLKKDFVIDQGGGMKLVDQVKIAAQNNVIKFVMSTLKKNLFSGKGILNISLPVQIFNIDSNIQRLCDSMALAPDFIEKRACKQTDPVQRFKHCIAFALSNSVLYFDIDKVFNPILGETFQGFIAGCPVYGEQISHHPPISSILLVGRGYRVYTNIEAKVYVHINSGQGVNEGLYTIEFDDGSKVFFLTAPGEVSGLVVGDRKYRIKGKTYVIDSKNRLFSSINFEDQSGLFSKNKWKFSDQMDGDIVRVTEGFIQKFFEQKEGIVPAKKQIEEYLGKLSGRWIERLLIDGQEYYNLNQIPYEMIQYEFPLNSNSNYRQDLIYRKRQDLARSQLQKQRLEVLQRNDKKMRQKYHPGKH